MPLRLAIADDALFIRQGLRRMLADDGRVLVVGTAASGEELLENVAAWRPDIVTLDLEMPGMGGLRTLDRLMAQYPLPVIVLSTRSSEGAPATVEALSRGAVDFIDKTTFSLVDFHALRTVLVSKLLQIGGGQPPLAIPSNTPAPRAQPPSGDAELIVIGASTGGPRAVETVLSGLGGTPAVPIVIVQHMPAGFTSAFAARLDRILPLSVCELEDGALLRPGAVGIAAAGWHVRIARHHDGLRASLSREPSDVLHVPSVDVLFNSAAPVTGHRSIAVLLTGMGSDGAQGMRSLAAAGAHTIAQDEASCIVYGMPRAAVQLGAVSESLPLADIGPRLHALSGVTTIGGVVAARA